LQKYSAKQDDLSQRIPLLESYVMRSLCYLVLKLKGRKGEIWLMLCHF